MIRTPFGESSSISGLFVRKEDTVIVVLNTNRTRGHQHFTAAHELYHVRYNEGMSGRACTASQFPRKQSDELNADKFAAHLLVPDAGLRYMLAKLGHRPIPDWATILQLEQYFQVSHTAMLWRLRECGYFRNRAEMDGYAPAVIQEARKRGYDTRLYERDRGYEVISDIPEKVTICLERGLISQGRAEELLGSFGYTRASQVREGEEDEPLD
ncbi:MAG: ImmA/IrrE family metallo-endopeptidase [Bacteroidota bacterium]